MFFQLHVDSRRHCLMAFVEFGSLDGGCCWRSLFLCDTNLMVAKTWHFCADFLDLMT